MSDLDVSTGNRSSSFPEQQREHASDAALAVYSVRPPNRWRGSHRFPGGKITFADPARAQKRLHATIRAAQRFCAPKEFFGLIEESIRLDYVGALNDPTAFMQRARAYSALGHNEPARALLLYDIGVDLSRLRLWSEAATVYDAASKLDSFLIWPLNNHAWLLATATEPSVHNGNSAIALAEKACGLSGWGCWCFLGTLAAAFARTSDFERASAWQRITLHLTPPSERAEALAILRQFEAGQAYIDHRLIPAAGGESSEAELAQIDVSNLLIEAEALIGSPRTRVH